MGQLADEKYEIATNVDENIYFSHLYNSSYSY